MWRRAIVATALPAAALMLASCSSGAVAPNPQASTTQAPATAPAAASTSAPAQVLTVGRVVAALKAHGLPVTLGKVFTAVTDPNHLLGRPGEYISKADFADSRVSGSEVAGGGSVEVFTNNADAVRRASYIQAVTQAAPVLGAEYDYVAGVILLRVSGQLTPAQARTYEAALQAIAGTPASQPSPAST